MTLFLTLRIAARALLLNKTRSFLTMLGIIIGVGSVIAMAAIGAGAREQVRASFATMGANLLIITGGSSSRSGGRGGWGSQATVTWDDFKTIQTDVPSVRLAAPLLRSNGTLVADEQNWTTSVQGTTPDYFDLRSWALSSGTRFDAAEAAGGAKVVVLGQTVVGKLWGEGADPVGRSVRISNIPFEVIGVLAKLGQSPYGTDYDDCAMMPVTTFMAKIQGGSNALNGWVIVGASSSDGTGVAQRQLTSLLRDRHHLDADPTDPRPDDFQIRNLTEMASAEAEGTSTITNLLAAIAGVSMMVGGIGIMNIMLVSVSERTREIGLRLAVGATPANILWQFLVEALLLASVGGFVGIGLGVGAASRLAHAYGWPLLIDPDVVVGVVCFSAVVGVIFGLYPARHASQLDPIEALRSE